MENRYILHMTHVGNLSSLEERGCLLSDVAIEAQGLDYQSIAHAHIKERRRQVTTPLGCTLAECVPFYFWAKTPMLYALFKNNVIGYAEGQRKIVYLVSTIQNVVENHLEFCFTDGHAAEAITNYYVDLKNLDLLDWNAICSEKWGECFHPEDPDFKRRKQAEFLVKDSFPLKALKGIATYDEEIAKCVREVFPQITVSAWPQWFF